MVLQIKYCVCVTQIIYFIELGLGYYSEQAMEAQHHDFKVFSFCIFASSESLGEDQSAPRPP